MTHCVGRSGCRIHGGTFGNESLLKKTAAERQLQRLRKRKESTSSTTAQQSRRMDASTQTIEEENIYSENESNSLEEETDKTNTTKTQVGLNKNIEVEKLVEISINTKEDSDSTQRINKERTKEKSLLDTTVREDSNTGVEQRILGLRSTPNLVHTELGPVKRKQRVKMSSVKATIEQVTAMIPVCAAPLLL
ncbi:hypothetical protein AGLY_018205 [Aphis glycines]|uniref:Uncharacterized protein n=1 Tax=Aphis glycines TaxID=307491 RepID=A0A6G0SSP8_APHGL|nr:hypothetical protein AGLY_018205 [Aphis glycines]